MGNSSSQNRHFPAHIFANADRPGYYAGEMVTGRVYLMVNETFPCQGVYLSLKGEERAWVHRIHRRSEKKGKHTHHYDEYENYKKRKIIFEANQIVLQMLPGSNGLLEPGQYEIPFQFHLPSNLPGSFFEERRIGGEFPANRDFYSEIVYSLKAYVDEGKVLPVNQQIASKSFLKVGTANPGSFEPVLAEQTRGMYKCCCFKQGDLYMKTYPDEAVYKEGDRIKLNLEVANRSKQNIQKIDVRLIRKMKLKVVRTSRSRKHRKVSMKPFSLADQKEEAIKEESFFDANHTENITDVMSEAHFEGLAPFQEAIGNNARSLFLYLFSPEGKKFETETAGSVISCEYFIQVMCDAENCCVTDIPLDIQTHIIPDINTGLEATCYAVAVPIKPEDWAPTVQPAVLISDENIKFM